MLIFCILKFTPSPFSEPTIKLLFYVPIENKNAKFVHEFPEQETNMGIPLISPNRKFLPLQYPAGYTTLAQYLQLFEYPIPSMVSELSLIFAQVRMSDSKLCIRLWPDMCLSSNVQFTDDYSTLAWYSFKFEFGSVFAKIQIPNMQSCIQCSLYIWLI